MDSLVYHIALGSNLPRGDLTPFNVLTDALSALAESGAQPVAISRFFKTRAFPAGAGPDFINACAIIKTTLHPEALIKLMHEIEARLGRVRDQRWVARTLDLDIISCGGAVLPDPETETYWRSLDPEAQKKLTPEVLILPHPRMAERGFVLIPLVDIAPDWRHPVLGRTVAELVAALPEAEKAEILPL